MRISVECNPHYISKEENIISLGKVVVFTNHDISRIDFIKHGDGEPYLAIYQDSDMDEVKSYKLDELIQERISEPFLISILQPLLNKDISRDFVWNNGEWEHDGDTPMVKEVV